MNTRIECWCGEPTQIEGHVHEEGADLFATCPGCQRRFVVTISEFSGPRDD